jgi:peptide/nickel transport system ATP-binding protein
MSPGLLVVEGLGLEFTDMEGRRRRPLAGIDMEIRDGEIVGVAGESGSGKSLTALTVLGLLPPLRDVALSGSIRLAGRELVGLMPSDWRHVRGREVAYIPQEPMNALNPTMRIGTQLSGVLRHRQGLKQAGAVRRGLELLQSMSIRDPDRVWSAYPFELSGGMRQRVLIAMAFACEPRLVIADEPTTALDVTVQAQILELLRERATEAGASVLFVSHDLAVLSELCQRLYVMYAGYIMESGPTPQVLGAPRHPYTRALLACRPTIAHRGSPLPVLGAGSPAAPGACAFAGRCALADPRCADRPPWTAAADHRVACWQESPT